MSAKDDEIVSEMTQMLERLDDEEETVSKCPSCDSPVDAESAYCSSCGQQLRKPQRPKVIVRRITIT